ncbi:MAG: class I SAM-dependent methyltransferase [Xanthomonadales bacterium]|nr:class I SAM-dependent methyltransferase [Xanthomonadales bacterium]
MADQSRSDAATLPRMYSREALREQSFSDVWRQDLDKVFADLAPRYDLANDIATLGMAPYLRRCFMRTIDLQPGQRVLDVCAGTNIIGITLLIREPTLDVHAMDRSSHMQDIGRQKAEKRGFKINSTIGDVTTLPYPDDYFDLVTLQFASRHLRVYEVFSEIFRVLKPGGRFHHSDMLRPTNPVIKRLYYTYLRACLGFTSALVKSGQTAHKCKPYFIDALDKFYSPEELSHILTEVGFETISVSEVVFGTLGFHRGCKPKQKPLSNREANKTADISHD